MLRGPVLDAETVSSKTKGVFVLGLLGEGFIGVVYWVKWPGQGGETLA